MYNQQLPSDGQGVQSTPSLNNGSSVFGKTAERASNERIKHLLKSFGLRTSLIRLKVIDALLTAEQGERSLGVRGIHSQLLELDIPLSFLSVREVLKRLCSEGVITLNSDKSYSLHQQAAAVLDGRA
ncbi:fe2+ zn2+ uptake regulation protein [Pseudomonas chlororaphis]|jgi:Fe2+ or Zn2+ uptake regulation protein|uniref:Fe2+ zn2+ uptake regulation protein n=1 Tax=Pseudomonas morbosilactucae TaxID=2938197 RepID=A0A9X2C5Y6_9PSED|nr:fe2+ zn2+ uptake regulation protein [Pseudomonas morbosilactucae]MCK9798727.1 fe2+ zn2+ uptake regulation protein [Pseudomonas morbosilactucae]MCK9814891.1 fe2+ zn2+ uptake regulation protein [Pseudomonas morbosilactucae]ROL69561.1 fe2+ zn2+ uptake regulation protein [Pseudomonas chlororaphis]WEK07142.1 MAG: fe2+ zn2+ uptake regulation protein [Pseudomonas sp.]